MKSKNGYQEWSNGHIKLFYLDDEKYSFINALLEENIDRMVSYSVAEMDLKTSLMRRTEHGKKIFNKTIRSPFELTARVREMNR